jgi:DNA-directed RNA polymerase subunit RPC12/RpoP
MSEISNRAAYLKGLADGLKLDKNTNEGQLIDGILGLLGDIAEELEMLDQEQIFLEDKIDEMDEVIEMIADETFGAEDEDEFYTLICENCGAEIDLTGDDLDDIADGVFKCPDCGEVIELDFDGCDCGCDCDCGHDHN